MDKNNFQEASKYGTFPLSIFLKIKGSISGFIPNLQAVQLNLSCLERLVLFIINVLFIVFWKCRK